MDPFLDRAVNDDLSGGEKKRSEIFQMAVLRPKVALLDEIDSGLDIDAVREVAAAVELMRTPEVGVLLITHYSRILRYLNTDRIHVMIAGQIVESGGPELSARLEEEGYEGIRERLGIEVPAEGVAEKRPADFFTETPFDLETWLAGPESLAIPVSSLDLSIRSWGSGPKQALLLHGISSNAEGWWRVGPALAELDTPSPPRIFGATG